MRVFFVGICILVPATILYPLAPSGAWGAAGFALFMLGQCFCGSAGPASLTFLTSSEIRSTATALYFMFLSLVSLTIGPMPVGLLVDWMGDPALLRYAISIVAALVGIPAMIVVVTGFGAYRRGVEEVEAMITRSEARPAHG